MSVELHGIGGADGIYFSKDGGAPVRIAELFDASGASHVGFKQAGANTVERTVEEKLREIVTPMDLGAVGDGVTDDRLALQRCFNYATSVGAEVNLCGKTYACSGKLFINGAQPINLHDGSIIAIGTTWGAQGAASGALVEVQRPTATQRRHKIVGVYLDCNYVARSGWYLYRAGSGTIFIGNHARRFIDYGFWVKGTGDGNNDLKLINCFSAESTAIDEPKYSTYSERTGVAFFIDTSADVELIGCAGSSSKHALKFDGSFWNFKVLGGNYWNGNGRTDPSSVTVLVGADVKRGSFIGTRFDDGAVKLYSFMHKFLDCEWIQFEYGYLQLVATEAGEIAKHLIVTNNSLGVNGLITNPTVVLSTEGAGTWGSVECEWANNKGPQSIPVSIQNKSLITAGLTIENGNVNLSGELQINGVKALGPKDTGWTAATGTPNKGAYATYAGQTASAVYDQAEAQATDDATKANSQRIKAIEDALRTHGLID